MKTKGVLELAEAPQSIEDAEAMLRLLAEGAPQTLTPPAKGAAKTRSSGKRKSTGAADRLKQTEARYRTLVEQIPAITFMASLVGGVDENEIYISPHIETMLGFTQAEWLGDPFLWYRQLHPDDRARWGAEFARTCAAGVHFSSEYRFLSRDGRVVWVHGEARVVRDEDGRPLFLQGIAFDISESKRAEQDLRRSAEELERMVRERTSALEEASMRAEAASQARASFLANMSHEIRTPLNGIIGFADLLRRGAGSCEAERMEWLDIIRTSGEHLLALINDILDLSKIDAGKLSVESVDCSPLELIEEVCRMLRSKAEEKALGLTASIETPLPRIIRTDPTRLRQILMNLAGNAVKFTREGSVRIVARLENMAGEARLKLQVVDTGIGIAAEKLATIFDPFTQADSSITRQFGGTGLGLAISRRLADALDGTISVNSELGRGTTFTLEIPLGPIERLELVDARAPAAKPADTGEVAVDSIVLKHRILVADDGDTNRKLLRVLLERAGASITEVENGRQAIERLAAEPFDLVLMDMQMPLMDGYSATRELRGRGIKIPIIALTANAMKGDEQRCREAGCSGYLAKPITHKQLLSTVAGALGANLSAAAPPAVSAPPPPKPPRSTAAAIGSGLVSSLPADDPDFREIIEEFSLRVREKLAAMRSAWTAEDLPELVALAHWLKGASGSAGFGAFVQPAQELEEFARRGRTYAIEALIGKLERLAHAIAVD